jgi:hypothetical protein
LDFFALCLPAVDNFIQRPDVISDSSSHRWCNAQGLMDAAEIVKGEPRHDSGTVILELLAEAVS